MGKHRIKPNKRSRSVRLPDLDHCKRAVLNSLGRWLAGPVRAEERGQRKLTSAVRSRITQLVSRTAS